MTLTGNGFSFAAPENVISVGGSSVSAESYEISEEGSETLVFTLPEDAPEGETEMILIVEGHASNALPFTVTPTP